MKTIFISFFAILTTFFVHSHAQASIQFCAVTYWGKFTCIDSQLGEIPPTRTDMPSTLQELAWSPGGVLYAGRSKDLYSIDPTSSDYRHVLSINSDIRGMAFSSDGKLYITAGTEDASVPQKLRVVNLANGQCTDIGTLWGGGTGSQGLAFDPNGVLYGISPVRNPKDYKYYPTLFTINLNTAEMHYVGSAIGSTDQAITFAPDGNLYAIGKGSFAQLNPLTGAVIGTPLTFVPKDNTSDYRGLAVVTIPEPSTIALLLTACVGGLLWWRRRR